MLMLRLPMVICIIYFVLVLLKNTTLRYARPPILIINRSAKSRRIMMEIMTLEVQTSDLKEAVNTLIPDSTGKDTEKACQSIYPLHDVFIRRTKMQRKPKFELGKLMELPGEDRNSGKANG
jgi:ribosomal protein S3AE